MQQQLHSADSGGPIATIIFKGVLRVASGARAGDRDATGYGGECFFDKGRSSRYVICFANCGWWVLKAVWLLASSWRNLADVV